MQYTTVTQLQSPSYYLPMERLTRQYHPQHFILLNSSTTAYQSSYFSRTINEWNDLPPKLIQIYNLPILTPLLYN